MTEDEANALRERVRVRALARMKALGERRRPGNLAKLDAAFDRAMAAGALDAARCAAMAKAEALGLVVARVEYIGEAGA